MLASKIGLFLVGGGFIGAAATSTLLSKNYLGGLEVSQQAVTQEETADDGEPQIQLTGIKCTHENGDIEEVEIVQWIKMDDSLRQSVATELKGEDGKCLTSSDQKFNYY